MMKNLFLLIILVFSVLSFNSAIQEKKSNSDKFTIYRGTNLAHWLSQSDRRGEARERIITQEDIKAIAGLGFDHVRLPIDEEQMWDENGIRHPEAFQIMENCINWCRNNHLKVVVDLHILRSHHFNADVKPLWTDPKEQEKFCKLWFDLSSALNKYPNSLVAYELLNEAVTDDPGQWNQLIDRAMKVLRQNEPNRTIVIGSNKWQSYNTFDELKVPGNDKNILLSFHFYEPFLLTHYRASWTNLRNYSGSVHYPGILLSQEEFEILPDAVKPEVKNWIGRKFDRDVIGKMFEKPLAKARSLGLPLYCGEYGVISNAPEEDRLRWYADMLQLFHEKGIASANWNYKSGSFGLVDGNGNRNEALIKVFSRN